jgi:type IV secretory pathway VirB6-like protein
MKNMIKKIVRILMISGLFLLTSCGDGCYEDPNIKSQTQASYTKTYSASIQSNNSGWINTGIYLNSSTSEQPLNDVFKVINVSGMSSCASNPNSPGQCAINYSTMCDSGTQYVCNDPGTCKDVQQVDVCAIASQPNCTQADGCCVGQGDTCSAVNNCAGDSGQQMCYNGQLYQYLCYVADSSCTPGGGTACNTSSAPSCPVCECGSPGCSGAQWVNTCSPCIEAVSCGSNNNKNINFPYTVTKSDGSVYSCNAPINVGTCTPTETECPYGVAKQVSATNQSWTQIDTNIFPGDDIYLKILPPTLGSGIQMPMASAPTVGNSSLNAWSSTINWRYLNSANQCSTSSQQNCPCPTQANGAPLQVTQDSQFFNCPFLDQGYYTCPMCEGPNRGWSNGLNNSGIWGQCDGSGEALQCWYTGGSGMWLKIISSVDDCNSTPNCQAGDTNCIWFDQVVSTNSITDSIFGLIQYQPSSYDGPNCKSGGDYSYCNNRLTTRHMTGSGNELTQICAKMADEVGSFGDNLGGYVVYDTRTSCVGYNGLPSAAVAVMPVADVMALEYIVSANTPSSSENGTPFCSVSGASCDQSSSLNNLIISNAGTGYLYLRIRDCSGCYNDNTGSYDVNIQYTQYLAGGIISSMIEDVRKMIFNISFSIIESYFNGFCVGAGCSSSGIQFMDYIRTLLVLYVAFYGISFTIGTVRISQKELVVMSLKIGLVLTIISPSGFDFFYNDFFALFFNGMNELIIDSQVGFGGGEPSSNVFAFADNIISLTLLNATTWLKLVALSAISPMGLILAILMIVGVILCLVGIFKAVLVYLMSILVLCILILLAPIFIPFCLFKMTKKLFDNWINAFARYSLEPVILIIGLTLLTELAYVLLIQIINFQVCWKCIWPINFDFAPSIVSALNLTETIFCIQFFAPFGMMPSGGSALISAMGVEVVDILLFVIIGHLMLGYDKFISEMTNKITEGASGKFSKEGGSVGSAVLNRTGIPQKVSGFIDKQKNKLKRAAINTVKPSQEDSLLKQAKKTESMYNEQQKGMARYLSDVVTNGLSYDPNGSLKKSFDTLNDKSASAADQAQAARSLGSGLYGAMSARYSNESDEYYANKQKLNNSLMGNLSKLSSIEGESEAYKKLSPEARELREALATKEASDALKVLNNKDASDSVKQDAMGALSESMFRSSSGSHKILFNPVDADQRAKLIEEVMRLERVPDSEIKRAVIK